MKKNRYKLTPAEREARGERRANLRQAAANQIQLLREWRDQRERDAAARRAKKKPETRSRGVDRVPDRLRGLTVTVEPHTVSKRRNPIDSTLGTFRGREGNHADRRARGQRGKGRKPRRRELPGAEARRIERNREAWS